MSIKGNDVKVYLSVEEERDLRATFERGIAELKKSDQTVILADVGIPEGKTPNAVVILATGKRSAIEVKRVMQALFDRWDREGKV